MKTFNNNAPLKGKKFSTLMNSAKQRRFIVQCLFFTTLTMGLVACGSGPDQDLRDYVKQVKAKKKGHIPPLPEPQKFEVFTYDDSSLRDPFVPEQTLEAASHTKSGPRPDANREKEVLEGYALGSLKLMGSLEKDGRRWALIKAPDGTLYRTTKGHHMGQNNGVILKISESQLELKEIVPDGLGGYVERFSTLTVNE
jgi:type IV pilus assembly protein PilP